MNKAEVRWYALADRLCPPDPSPTPADPLPGIPATPAAYSFPGIPVMERRISRCSHLVRTLATADNPALGEELHARLAEGDPTIAEAIRSLPRPPTP